MTIAGSIARTEMESVKFVLFGLWIICVCGEVVDKAGGPVPLVIWHGMGKEGIIYMYSGEAAHLSCSVVQSSSAVCSILSRRLLL